MDESPAVLSRFFVDDYHLFGASVPGQKNATLFEELTDGSTTIGGSIFVLCVVLGRRTWPVLVGQVTAREDMGRRERAGCLDAMQQKDLILWGDENHAEVYFSNLLS